MVVEDEEEISAMMDWVRRLDICFRVERMRWTADMKGVFDEM
jgi:hypothetical protein